MLSSELLKGLRGPFGTALLKVQHLDIDDCTVAYGSVLDDFVHLRADRLIENFGKTDCKVRVDFDGAIEVSRQLQPNSLSTGLHVHHVCMTEHRDRATYGAGPSRNHAMPQINLDLGLLANVREKTDLCIGAKARRHPQEALSHTPSPIRALCRWLTGENTCYFLDDIACDFVSAQFFEECRLSPFKRGRFRVGDVEAPGQD